MVLVVHNNLIELSYLETILGVDASLVAIREQAIAAASSAVHKWLGRDIIYNPTPAQMQTQKYDGGHIDIIVNEWPLQSVGAVSSVVDGATTVLTEGTDFEVNLEEGVITALPEGSTFTTGRNRMSVLFTAGYSTYTEIPVGLQQGVAEWALYILNHQRSSGLVEDTIGQCRKLFEILSHGHPPKHVAALLAPYKALDIVGRVN